MPVYTDEKKELSISDFLGKYLFTNSPRCVGSAKVVAKCRRGAVVSPRPIVERPVDPAGKLAAGGQSVS
jgi:hypothetical protein